MKKYEIYAILLSICTAITGFLVAVLWQEAHWFARSGAVVTVIGIIFASLKLSDRVAKAIELANSKIQEHRADFLQNLINRGMDQANAEKLFLKFEAEIRGEVATSVQEFNRRFLKVEISVLIAGTLLWGFGDLPLDSYFEWDQANQSVEPNSTGETHNQCCGCKFWVDTKLLYIDQY